MNWIPKLKVQFCYLGRYLSIETVSYRRCNGLQGLWIGLFISLCNDLRNNLLSNHTDDTWLTIVIIIFVLFLIGLLSLLTERLRFTFTPILPPPSRAVSRPNSLPLPFRTPATQASQTADVNLYHVTKFTPYFQFTLYCFYTKIGSFMPVLTIGIVRGCFLF